MQQEFWLALRLLLAKHLSLNASQFKWIDAHCAVANYWHVAMRSECDPFSNSPSGGLRHLWFQASMWGKNVWTRVSNPWHPAWSTSHLNLGIVCHIFFGMSRAGRPKTELTQSLNLISLLPCQHARPQISPRESNAFLVPGNELTGRRACEFKFSVH